MKINANGLQIELDDQGPPGGPVLLFIMGLGMQLVAWPEALVADLVRRGFRVLRFDNRDVGLSQGFDHLGVPSVSRAMMRYALHLPVQAPYHLADMADDALGVLDALGLAQAHVCGASMGGMVAQHLALRHPQRVRSLALLMTSSGARHLPRPTWAVQQAMLRRPRRGAGLDEHMQHLEQLLHTIGSPAHRPEPAELRRHVEAVVRRAHRPAGTLRQLLAIAADGDRSTWLGQIRAPTLVVHGSADPLIPPAAGDDLARKIPGARLERIAGMGHDLPGPLLPRLAALLAEHAQAVGG